MLVAAIFVALWLAELHPQSSLDWRVVYAVAAPLLVGGLVVLGIFAMLMLKVIRSGEAEWWKLFQRAILTPDFERAACEAARELVRKKIEEAMIAHDNKDNLGVHRAAIDHQVRNLFQAIESERARFKRGLE